MGSAKKRGGSEAAEEPAAAAPGGGSAGGGGGGGGGGSSGRPREHRKHRHRGGERRGKRSRSRGERGGGGSSSGGSRRAAGEEPSRGSHGRSGDGERRRRERREEREDGAPPAKTPVGETSLSVEETNKLRAKLGLKPLDSAPAKKEAGTQEEPVVAEALNPLAQRQRQEIRERLAAAKEKRLLNQRLGKVRPLGEEAPWLDDAAAWIERSRQLQRQKEMAQKRAKLLEEMDQEFGVSSLVEEDFLRRKRELYSARDLQGLTVEHDLEAFKEGETLVLTLKDKGVLEEREDVLENAGLAAAERAREALELRKKKPNYDPYDLEEAPAPAQAALRRDPLPQYSEAPARPSFRLGAGGALPADLGVPPGPAPPGPAPHSLQLPPLRPAHDYLTPQEMREGFRRCRRRVRRLRRKEKALKADELLPGAPPDPYRDFGSRTRGRGRRKEEEEEEAEEEVEKGEEVEKEEEEKGKGGKEEGGEGQEKTPPEPPENRDPQVESSSDEEVPPDSPAPLEEDEAERELQLQLERGRRLRQLQQLRQNATEKVLERIRDFDDFLMDFDDVSTDFDDISTDFDDISTDFDDILMDFDDILMDFDDLINFEYFCRIRSVFQPFSSRLEHFVDPHLVLWVLFSPQAKLLEEMDQEFGVSSLVEEDFLRRKRELYSARDLQGLTVEHDLEAFKEGETLVLTLKDKGVLEEREDVLENAGLAAAERAREALELRKKKPNYDPYDLEEAPAPAQAALRRDPLPQYSEAPARPSFRLGAGGALPADLGVPPGPAPSGPAPHSLQLPPLRPAHDYLTPQEMREGFRRCRRRVRRLRRKEKALKADELLPGAPPDPYRDFGSRTRGRGRRKEEEEEEAEEEVEKGEEVEKEEEEKGKGGKEEGGEGQEKTPPEPPENRDPQVESSSDEEVPPDSPAPLEEDEAERELQLQLERGRRLRQLQQLRQNATEKVLERIRGAGGGGGAAPPPTDPRGGNIVFNATSEFCRTLGEIPTYGLAGNREEQEELLALERAGRPSPPGPPDSEGDENVGWSSVNLAEERQHPEFSASSTTILDEEPIVNRGLAAALLLCQNKGLLETTVQKVPRVKAPNKSLPSAVYCIEDKMAIDDKYSRREEYRGFTQDFKEKEGYRPDVKIEYVDETGRKLTPKEAFRQLSHRFHGKGSGKMKTERRMKKLDEEALLKRMSSSDTPLGTVALLTEKQKAQKTPYIVLSGSGKSMNANTITK
ncbi:U4/U6.U5 tri-snRNP-associated protein 1 [Cuculus canorus]|uniref:U4/U6.U5 tri-snRNP-associated protein 1 n=1 Tax=Cuculus canorus TaxID=55661 RepID=UPI0023AAE1B5|nr:U4/U6.U5 tri-snRNP-associated protein 1 [Cuculus canorus]